jgi:hypothetical protein
MMTWDEIESLIDDSPAARAFLGYEQRESVAETLQSVLQPLHAKLAQQGGERFADLDEAKARLDAGKPQAALVFVQRARRRNGATSRHRSAPVRAPAASRSFAYSSIVLSVLCDEACPRRERSTPRRVDVTPEHRTSSLMRRPQTGSPPPIRGVA